MDIALMSMSLSQGQIQQQASLSVMEMAMGNAKQQGEAVKELISSSNVKALQQAAQPHLGGNIDLKL
ncbi:putative motility protein [Priestia megaterium]|uniref:YjfB family protein n=1 Tax=Priestia megaterium TaxID=1404 RepID=UPI0010AC7752|nr:YjfB family protein [Priestia megaterium]TJZ35554.1 putative motility protein [Priestia megaterium]